MKFYFNNLTSKFKAPIFLHFIKWIWSYFQVNYKAPILSFCFIKWTWSNFQVNYKKKISYRYRNAIMFSNALQGTKLKPCVPKHTRSNIYCLVVVPNKVSSSIAVKRIFNFQIDHILCKPEKKRNKCNLCEDSSSTKIALNYVKNCLQLKLFYMNKVIPSLSFPRALLE